MKKITALLLAAVIVLTAIALTACGGGNSNSPAVGTWKGVYTKLVGSDDDAKNTEDEFTLVLNANGKGKHTRDGSEFDVKWSLDGENFQMTETFLFITIEYTGTLSGNSLVLYNGDPEDIWTYIYAYEKAE